MKDMQVPPFPTEKDGEFLSSTGKYVLDAMETFKQSFLILEKSLCELNRFEEKLSTYEKGSYDYVMLEKHIKVKKELHRKYYEMCRESWKYFQGAVKWRDL